MELFDFVQLIGGVVTFQGSYDPQNTYVNAQLEVNHRPVRLVDDTSTFGRLTQKMTLDGVLHMLACQLSGKRIRAELPGGETSVWNVPKNLMHTPGYQNQKRAG